MNGSGISWGICKCAPRFRQITTPAPHYAVFTGRMPFLPPNQVSKQFIVSFIIIFGTLSSPVRQLVSPPTWLVVRRRRRRRRAHGGKVRGRGSMGRPGATCVDCDTAGASGLRRLCIDDVEWHSIFRSNDARSCMSTSTVAPAN